MDRNVTQWKHLGPVRARATALVSMVALHACYAKEPAREASPPPAQPAFEEPASQQPPAPPAAPPAPAADEAERGTGAAPGGMGAPAPRKDAPPKPSRSVELQERRRAGSALEESVTTPPKRSARIGEPEQLMQRLGAAVDLATPNCPAAKSRKAAICDIAQQICELEGRDPNVASVAAYCEDARRRCAEAGQRVSERCPE